MSDNLYAELQSFKVKANADVLDLNVVGTPRAALNAQTFTPRPPPSSNASASSNSKRFLASKPRVQLSIESAPRSSLLEIRAAKLAKDKADLEAAEAAAAAEKERLRVEREIAANSMTRAARRWVRLKLVIRIGGASKFRSSMAEFDAVANAEGTFTDETATEESYLGQEGSEEHRRQTAEAAAVAAQLNVPIDCKSNEVFKFESSDKLPLWHATVLTPYNIFYESNIFFSIYMQFLIYLFSPETRLQADCEHLALLLMPLSFNCFKDLTLSTMTAIAKKMRYQTFTPMSLMCKAGEPGFIAYFIISGSASVLIRPAGAEFDICVKRFGAGFSVGEPSLHNPDAIRSATLRADLTPLEVLTLSRADYQTAINSGAALTRSAEDEFAAEARVAKEREMQEALAKVSAIPVDTKVGSNFRFQSSSARPRWFTTVSKPCVQRNEEDCYHVGTLLADLGLDCFKTYTPDMFRSMVSRMTFDTLPPFYTICKTGEAARTAYIVLSGSVSVLIRPKGAPADICVKRFGPGYRYRHLNKIAHD
jgi:CRP-like cAMP-binding protein